MPQGDTREMPAVQLVTALSLPSKGGQTRTLLQLTPVGIRHAAGEGKKQHVVVDARDGAMTSTEPRSGVGRERAKLDTSKSTIARSWQISWKLETPMGQKKGVCAITVSSYKRMPA
jgi:hypothetical protein